MNSRFVLPASLFSCCVCVVNDRRKALLLVLLCDLGTLHAKKVTELLHKQQHTQREKREAEQNRRILQKTCYVCPYPLACPCLIVSALKMLISVLINIAVLGNALFSFFAMLHAVKHVAA